MSKTDRSIELMGEVIQTASLIGSEKTKQAIIDARRDIKYLDKTIGDLIKKHICKAFSISRDKLMLGTSKGTRTDALMVGYVLAKKYLDYKLLDIAILFKKDESNISKSITAFNRLQDNNKQDKIILDKYEKISVIIEEFRGKNLWPENQG
jgi:chromosomal replication initiation ATPase DnaA